MIKKDKKRLMVVKDNATNTMAVQVVNVATAESAGRLALLEEFVKHKSQEMIWGGNNSFVR